MILKVAESTNAFTRSGGGSVAVLDCCIAVA